MATHSRQWAWRLTIVLLLTAVGCARPEGRDHAARHAGPPTGRDTSSTIDLPATIKPVGTLVIAGGGALPDDILHEAIRGAGGPTAPVLIVPQASRTETAGPKNQARFVELGCEQVAILDLTDEVSAVAAVDAAQLIWISGGSQNRLMRLLPDSVEAAIKRCYERGGVVGGSSAGAAVMSKAMITGDAKLKHLQMGTTELGTGLGLFPGAIVDQHFHRRQRFNRLLSAVLDRPELIGVGIDEGTAVIVQQGELSVVGNSSALILDARNAVTITRETRATIGSDGVELGEVEETVEAPELHGTHGVQLHVLRAGMKLSFAELRRRP